MRYAALALIALGCAPEFDADPSRVEGPRVLALSATPAQAAPGETVHLTALVVGTEAAPRFAICQRPKPPGEPRLAAGACLAGRDLQPTSAKLKIPPEACARFGSTPAPPSPGEPPRRAADPDATGGYYLPVRVSVEGAPPTFGRVRLRCPLPSAPAPVARDFAAGYAPNAPPTVRVEITREAGGVVLRARWPASDAETYRRYDRATGQLKAAQEHLSLRWFHDGGALRVDGASAWWTDATSEDSTWAVLNDDRGGTTWTRVPGP